MLNYFLYSDKFPFFYPSQMKLLGEKTGRKGHLAVTTEVLLFQSLSFEHNFSFTLIKSCLNDLVCNPWPCLFPYSDFSGGSFTFHGWTSKVWRRYPRISQGIRPDVSAVALFTYENAYLLNGNSRPLCY